MRWRVATAAIGLVVPLVAGVSSAGATTQTSTLGDITAVYTFHGSTPVTMSSHLKITRNGKVVYNRAVTSQWCDTACSPNEIAGARTVVHIAALQQLGSPSVVLDLYTGGAHCCAVEQVFSFGSSSTGVVKAEHNFGDPGARLSKLGAGGTYDFLSADDFFAYAFTDFAASGLPIQILSFSGGTFNDVTRTFPSLITKDASQWMTAFRAQAATHYQDSVGVVAAWAADEDMLGHTGQVATFLAAQARAGHLNSALSPINLSGHKFVVALQKFLRLRGYLTSSTG